MDQWHNLKLPKRTYLDFMRKTLWMNNLQYASTDLLSCGRPVDGWHVRSRKVENAGEASPYLEI